MCMLKSSVISNSCWDVQRVSRSVENSSMKSDGDVLFFPVWWWSINTSAYIQLQSMQFPFITYGMRYIYDNEKKSMNRPMRASGASELRRFLRFHIKKTTISFNILLIWYFVRETYIFRPQITSAVSFYYLWYGTMYKWQYTDKTLTLWKSMYIYASERSKRS